MKTLYTLTDESLLTQTQVLVQEELRIGLEVLSYLREIERRRIFAKLGFSSLFTFCIEYLKYSESQALLRIHAMRALRDNPEIEPKLVSGELNISAVAKVQRFLRKVRNEKPYTKEEKLSLFTRMQGKTTREVERELAAEFPEGFLAQERIRCINKDLVELKIVITQELLLKLNELKSIHSHRMKDCTSTIELLELLSADAIKAVQKKTEPKKEHEHLKKTATVDASSNIKQEKKLNHSRFIPVSIRKAVWNRDHGKCTYQDPKTNKRCGSKYFLQFDHIIPYSQGGSSSDFENLRLLCGVHNRHVWEKNEMIHEKSK